MYFRSDLAHLEVLSIAHGSGLVPSTSRWTDWIFGSCLRLASATRDSGVFQIGGSVSWLLLCECHLAFEQPSVVDLVFWSLRDRLGFPRTLHHGFLRTLRFLCFDGRRMFSLQDWRNPEVHDATSAWARLLAVIFETDTLCCTIFLPTWWIPLSRMHIASKVL